jgi:hypothetical protein
MSTLDETIYCNLPATKVVPKVTTKGDNPIPPINNTLNKPIIAPAKRAKNIPKITLLKIIVILTPNKQPKGHYKIHKDCN